MPKTDIDYSNTIIYKITCKDPTLKDVYVGHTTNFVQRKHAHKQSCINMKSANYKCKLYDTIRKNGGWNNWNMEIVGFFNCKDHYEARIKEQEFFVLLQSTLNSIEPIPKPKLKIEKSEPIERKIYYCEICEVKLQNLKRMEIHNQSNKHIKKQKQIVEEENNPYGITAAKDNLLIQNTTAQMENNGNEKRATFICDHCNYSCNKKTNYLRHLTSEKHNKNVNKIVKCNVCEHCNKEFTTQSGLWKHRKKCVIQENNMVDEKNTCKVIEKKPDEENKVSITNNIPMELILEVIKQSKEIQNVLVEQTKELQQKLLEQNQKLLEKENQLLEKEDQLLEQNKQIIELAKKPSMVNSNNNNNNNHFNLNFFLNETCKNAMNIQDFISSIKLTTQDFETTGRIGFVDGISRIFINELKRLEVERRPLHCTDMKRETVYVKDNDTWEKENTEKKKLKWAINSIAQLNLNQVQEWQQEYPECRENNTVANTQFNKMAMVALGGFGDEEETKFRDKIVKNVLKEIVVSKEI